MNFLELLRSSTLVAIVRGSDADTALRTVLTLFEEGIDVVEVSLVTAESTTVISAARAALGPTAMLGAGTVITEDDATAAARAGASFVVTPALGPGLAESIELGLPVVAGALTPTEIVEAIRLGADAIKLFPASLGGPGYLRALRDPFPEVPFVPVGGIDADLAQEYLRAGAVAVGIGSPLVGDAASGGSLESLRVRARLFVQTLKPQVQP